MIFIKEVPVNTKNVNQDFELGDLTIFIGRANSGKTNILNEIDRKAQFVNDLFKTHKDFDRISSELQRQKIKIGDEHIGQEITNQLIPSQRPNTSTISAFSGGFEKMKIAANRMDPTTTDVGDKEIQQKGTHKPLNIQGSGMQNMVQIFSKSFQPNFLLIDEPEISQFPNGKIEMLKHILESLDEKQIIFATHDPTLINQYIIKKYLDGKNFKVIVYSFCLNSFHKIDFNSDLNPEIHCAYLSQTLSGKPTHLIFEGQTDYYAFQALLHKYCLERKIGEFPRKINNIGFSFLGGNQWKINIHHVPSPMLYDVLIILDGEHQNNFEKDILPLESKIIESIAQIEKSKINIMFLKAKNIEKAFEGIFENPEKIPKNTKLSEKIWEEKEPLIEKLRVTSEESKQIYDIIDWAMSNVS